MEGCDCEIKILNGHDIDDIEKSIEAAKSKKINPSATIYRLMQMIVAFHGDDIDTNLYSGPEDRAYIRHKVESISAGDSKFIGAQHGLIAPEIIMIDENVICPKCYEMSDIVVNPDAGFFWPELVKRS